MQHKIIGTNKAGLPIFKYSHVVEEAIVFDGHTNDGTPRYKVVTIVSKSPRE